MHLHERGERPDLVAYHAHLIGPHNIPETDWLWKKADREIMDGLHVRAHALESLADIHRPIANSHPPEDACPDCLGGINEDDPLLPRPCGCYGLREPICGTCAEVSPTSLSMRNVKWPCKTWTTLAVLRQATEALRVRIDGGMIANIEQEGDRLSITTTDGGHFEVGIYAWTQPR